MHPSIRESVEQPRGCGYRKPGGLYLVSSGEGRNCGRLPIALGSCPCCGQSVIPGVAKRNRGFSWIENFDRLVQTEHCIHAPEGCSGCPLSQSIGRCGLIFVGQAFYPTPESFMQEASRQGISRRLPILGATTIKTSMGVRKVPFVPKGLVLGKTWIAMAHDRVIKNPVPRLAADEEYKELLPGIFYLFRPDAVEYVVRPEEVNDTEFIEYLVSRGIAPVLVKPAGQTPDMFESHSMQQPPSAAAGASRRTRRLPRMDQGAE